MNWKSSQFEETPLFIACQNGRLEIVEYMLASQRELNILSTNYQGTSPLEIAKINSAFEETLDHESEGNEKDIKQAKCLSIHKLLEEYQLDPNEVQKQLRKKLNFKETNL